jgi:hypothetical protein
MTGSHSRSSWLFHLISLHLTIQRFQDSGAEYPRLPARREAVVELNNMVLQEFAKRGLSINEGIDSVPEGTPPRRAVDARLVKSVSKPLGNDELRKLKDKRNTSEGKLNKNGNALKFSRDLESDWSVPCGIRNVVCLCT